MSPPSWTNRCSPAFHEKIDSIRSVAVPILVSCYSNRVASKPLMTRKSPFQTRLALAKVAVLIALPPLLLLGVMIWRGQSDPSPCRHQFPTGGGESLRLSAWSESEAKLRIDSPPAPGNQWLRGAWLEPPPGATWHQVVSARRDLTYVRCSNDPSERAAFLWFSEFDRAKLHAWLNESPDTLSQSPWRFVPVGSAADPFAERRLSLVRALLEVHAIRAPELFPDWVDPKALAKLPVLGWLDGGVLLQAPDPDRLLLVNRAAGMAAEAMPACSVEARDPDACDMAQAQILAAPTIAWLMQREPQGALEAARTATALNQKTASQDKLGRLLLDRLRRDPVMRQSCLDLVNRLDGVAKAEESRQAEQLAAVLVAATCARQDPAASVL
ncbi:MAG: hypothetical protein JNN30_19065 [Rhodanobacteraceae bacterium]|nr:hypothetical protein [Rhodanobacteraceae bacterium]